MPWEGTAKYFKRATGLPPHVMLYSFIKGIECQVRDIPKRMEDMLDKRQMAGPLSLERVMEAVEKSPIMAKIANDLASLRRQNHSLAASAAATAEHATINRPYNVMARLQREYQHPDKIYHRVPPTWKFPLLNLQPM